jgi:hypothetical protein
MGRPEAERDRIITHELALTIMGYTGEELRHPQGRLMNAHQYLFTKIHDIRITWQKEHPGDQLDINAMFDALSEAIGENGKYAKQLRNIGITQNVLDETRAIVISQLTLDHPNLL